MTDKISPEAQRLIEKIVPPPYRPPLLYLEVAANPEVMRALVEGPIAGLRGLLYTGQLPNADRELCILRVTARKRAVHEWGVHVAYFGKSSGLTSSQIDATASSAVQPDPRWTDRQRAIIAIADAVADTRALAAGEARLVESTLDRAERAELVVLASLYLGISAMCAVFEVPLEPGTPRMPGNDPMVLQQFDHARLADLMGWFPTADACRVWGGTQFRFPYTPESFRDDAKLDSLSSWMLVEAGEMVAFGQYYLRIGRCHLGRLAVAPLLRGRGIGTKLVRELGRRGTVELGVDDCSLFVLPGNERARRLYERLGFEVELYPDPAPAYAGCIYMVQRAKSAARPSR